MNVITTETLTNKIAAAIRESVNVEADPLRKEALDAFVNAGLPGPKSEEYKHTPIARYLEKNFSFNHSAASGPLATLSDFLIPDMEAQRIVFVDGVYSKEHSSANGPLKIERLEDALAAKNEIALQHFGRITSFQHQPLAAWNTAAWNHGIFIHVPTSTVVEKPIVLYHIVNGTGGEVVANNRNLIVLGRNSQVTVVEKFDSAGVANHFSNLVNEVVVDENAAFEYYCIQNDEHNRYQHCLTNIVQRKSSRVNTYTFTVSGKFYRNNLNLILDGEGIESHMYGLYLLHGDTVADNHTVVDHMKPNSFSNELYKGVMDGSSKGVFNGKIFVRPNAQKTNAFQANRNVLLSDQATVNTKPQLEIWADDVKCSHGCTSGQIDEEALFYLQSRGINRETARAMMLYAFVGDVLEHVPNESMKKYLDAVISDRLHKNF